MCEECDSDSSSERHTCNFPVWIRGGRGGRSVVYFNVLVVTKQLHNNWGKCHKPIMMSHACRRWWRPFYFICKSVWSRSQSQSLFASNFSISEVIGTKFEDFLSTELRCFRCKLELPSQTFRLFGPTFDDIFHQVTALSMAVSARVNHIRSLQHKKYFSILHEWRRKRHIQNAKCSTR